VASLLGEDSGEFDRQDLFAAWQRFLERVGGGDPLVFLVDDAQYADDGLLDFVEKVLGSSRTPMFVLLLARPELLEARPQLGGRRTSVIRLEPLPEPAMVHLVDDLVTGIPAEVRDELVKRSEGVPLYAVETVRALIDRELVVPSGGRYVVNPDHDIDLAEVGAPASLHALVAARLDALDPAERRVVGDASVLGEYFARADIGVLAHDVGDLDEVLVRLQRKELIATDVDRFSAERGQFRFVQSVVRQVAYSTLSRRDRKARHLAVAAHLEVQAERQAELGLVAAQHLVDAIDASAPDDSDVPELNRRAGSLLVRSGDRATRLGGHADALRAYRQAAERLTDERDRTEVLRKAAQSALDIGRMADCVELAGRAVASYDGLGEATEVARARSILARAHLILGELDTSLDVATKAYRQLPEGPAGQAVRADIAVTLGRTLMGTGGDDPLPYLGEALRLAEAAGDERVLVRAMSTMATYAQSHWSTWVGAALQAQVVELARARELWAPLVQALTNSSLLVRLRDLDEGTRRLEEAVTIAKEHGIDWRPPAVNLPTMLWMTGRWQELARLLADVAEAWPEVPAGDQAIFYAVDLWRRRTGAEPILPPREGSAGDLNWQSWDAHVHALEAGARRDPAKAGAEALRSHELTLADAGMTDDYLVQVPRMVRVVVECGQMEAAQVIVAQLEQASPTAATAGLHAFAAALRGLLGAHTGAPAEMVEADLRVGIEMLGEYGAVPDRALAQEDLGRWLLDQGRAREGSELLEAARSTYDELGAGAWLERVDRMLGVRA
jgi:tetratricopeptide (TPR) repeat protein